MNVFDILTGGAREDVFEMTLLGNSEDSADGAALGTIAEEDQLIVNLDGFGVFATQTDATNQITIDIVDRTDGTGSDVNFIVANADANSPITGSIALSGVTGLQEVDISLLIVRPDHARHVQHKGRAGFA